MSDDYLHFFPKDPLHRPEATVVSTALAEARPLFSWESLLPCEITVQEGDWPSFVDCGVNFETVRCPGCGRDLLDWWKGDRSDLAVAVPCCGIGTDLNALACDWPQGFACFCITVMRSKSSGHAG